MQNYSTEEWKDIEEYEGLYQVSNMGRVKSLSRMKRVRGNGLQPLPERILGITVVKEGNLKGRCVVNLWKDNKFKTHLVHRLVLTAFVGPCPKGMECRHFPDRDPANNRLENLNWGTRKQNMNDRNFHGTDNKGEKHGMSKLTKKEVLEIRKRACKGERPCNLSREYRVNEATIRDIRDERSWKHV